MAVPELPSGFVVENAPDRLARPGYRRGTLAPTTISFRRVDPRAVATELTGAALVLAILAVMAYELRSGGSAFVPIGMAAVLVGGLLLYARTNFRRVTVHVDDDRLVLLEGTPPEAVFWGVPSHVAQLYRVAEWRGGRAARQRGSHEDGDLRVVPPRARTYAVWVEMTDGTHQCLVSGLEHRDQAQYLEDVLEARLGLFDRPVEGEAPKNRD